MSHYCLRMFGQDRVLMETIGAVQQLKKITVRQCIVYTVYTHNAMYCIIIIIIILPVKIIIQVY